MFIEAALFFATIIVHNEMENLVISQDQPKFVSPGRNNIAWIDSPNLSDRPEGTVVDTIVLHHTAGSSLSGTVKWFEMPESQVSAHYTIGKAGDIIQQVSTWKRAWHAGNSIDSLGRSNVNNFSVGIEIVNLGNGIDPYTPEQVEAVTLLVTHLSTRRFPIKYIVSHEYIAEPAGRKNDPINYPWDSLKPLAERKNIQLIFGRKDQQKPK